MKTKEEILKEFEDKYCSFKLCNQVSKPELDKLKDFLSKAIAQTREETIRAVEEMIEKEFPHQKLYCEAQDLRWEILEELNKLKK